MTILLVDDDKDDQSLFCEAVKVISKEIDCIVAENGNEALNLLHGVVSLPDFVFLDVNMPIMDGHETLDIIHNTDSLRQINVIMYSTSNNKDEINEFLQRGVRYITKPNSFDQLVQVLTKAIFNDGEIGQTGDLLKVHSNYGSN